MMYDRYIGRFWSTNNVKWEVRIMQEADAPFAKIGMLSFPYRNPLTIEWPRSEKEDAVIGSMATLNIISPGDRTYEDLYTITPGHIRLDVYRNDALYWSGTLDPEFYEEPYAEYDEYEVSLTFSDFGILDRFKYNMTGLKSLQELLILSLNKAKINYNGIDQTLISTYVGYDKLTLSSLSVRSENWYDEDGEASTLREVIEGMLQPLSLRMEQRAGKIYLYDLNALYSNATANTVTWHSDDQMLGVDKVVNVAKITYSPYAESAIVDKDVTYDDKDGETVYDYMTDYKSVHDMLHSFNIHISNATAAPELAEKSPNARFFKIKPFNGASEASGVAYSFVSGRYSLSTGHTTRHLGDPGDKSQRLLMRTHRIYLPKLAVEDVGLYRLRITQELLIDPRYNPFVGAAEGNEEGNYKRINYWFGYTMIPASLTLYNDAGTALMHYRNDHIATNANLRSLTLRATLGEWQSGEGKHGSCWLSWYKGDDRKESSGVLDWKKNRPNIGLSTKHINAPLLNVKDGQYIPYPTEGGWLELCIYTGMWVYDYGETTWGTNNNATAKGLYGMIRWMLYKLPRIEILNANTMLTDVTVDDEEYSGVINADAADELSIDTVCGTLKKVCPSARGAYYNTVTAHQIKALRRADRTTQVEQLMIGTLYSQYAQRRTLLSGTANIISVGINYHIEAMQQGKRFALLSDVQDVANDSSEIEIVELRPDEYKDQHDV